MHDDQSMPIAQRLERGEVLYYPRCPFPLPESAQREFLLSQSLAGRHKNISLDPARGSATGFWKRSNEQAEYLRCVLREFSATATGWLAREIPRYARAWRLDRVTFRPDEEAIRRLRLTARNDLLHVDAFPSRPSQGWRILRLFVNLNAADSRIWVTSSTFAQLLERFGRDVGLPTSRRVRKLKARAKWLARLPYARSLFPGFDRGAYDAFMLRLHHFLKANDEFQQRARRRFWKFAPGSAWLVMTDGVSYAELRGQFALEHSYFIAPDSLALPDEAPAVLLAQKCGVPVGRCAA
jgi:hypothetical protein